MIDEDELLDNLANSYSKEEILKLLTWINHEGRQSYTNLIDGFLKPDDFFAAFDKYLAEKFTD